jgi:hypothetical protein
LKKKFLKGKNPAPLKKKEAKHKNKKSLAHRGLAQELLEI